MNLQAIAEHTFNVDQLTPGSKVLDVGCRDFKLAIALLDIGCCVCGVDPDPNITTVPDVPGFIFSRKALVSRPVARDKVGILRVPDDPYGAYIEHGSNPVKTLAPGSTESAYEVELIDIVTLSEVLHVDHWTAVKLDCEGSEYEILLDWPGPISDQISVEFHDHLHGKDMNQTYDLIRWHLEKWYDVHQWKRTGKKAATKNYWDVLFTLK